MKYLKFLILFIISFSLSGQVIVPGYFLDPIKKNADTSTLSFYNHNANNSASSFQLEPIDTKISYNSAYPRGFNDGPIWKGKGLTYEIHGGFSGSKGRLSYTLYPTFYYSQNSDFNLAPSTSPYGDFAYQFSNRIDWVQRYGNSSFAKIHLGQSEVKMTFGKFVTSLSTKNYSVGPSNFNPIILSSQGAGFPHLRIGSDPFDVKKIGKFEVNAIMGILRESDFHDSNSANDKRFFNGLFIGFSPNFISGLTLGFNKTMYKSTQFFEIEDLVSSVFIIDNGIKDGDTISTNDTFDQLASITIDWNFPEVNFRAYAEFAKNDFTGDARWTLLEPEHSRGFTVGFEKGVVTAKQKRVTLLYEHTTLSINHTYLWRATPPFYAHGINRQGYTHDGQLLGAGIGPGGNSDHFGIKIKNGNFHSGVLVQRMENNKDYFVRNIHALERHDVEYSLGYFLKKDLDKFSLLTELTFSHNFNRYYQQDSDAANILIMFGSQIRL